MVTNSEIQSTIENLAKQKRISREEYTEVAEQGSQISLTNNLEKVIKVLSEAPEFDLENLLDAFFILGAVYKFEEGTASEQVIQFVNSAKEKAQTNTGD